MLKLLATFHRKPQKVNSMEKLPIPSSSLDIEDAFFLGKKLDFIPNNFLTCKEVCTVLTIGHVYVPALYVLCKKRGLAGEVLDNRSHPEGVVLPENQSQVAVFCNIDEISKLISVIVELHEIHAALFAPDPEKVAERDRIRVFMRASGGLRIGIGKIEW